MSSLLRLMPWQVRQLGVVERRRITAPQRERRLVRLCVERRVRLPVPRQRVLRPRAQHLQRRVRSRLLRLQVRDHRRRWRRAPGGPGARLSEYSLTPIHSSFSLNPQTQNPNPKPQTLNLRHLTLSAES